MTIEIIPYQPLHREAFRSLNEEWITKYFKLEKPDLDALGDPENYILAKGGSIFVAMHNDEAVGVCALCARTQAGSYELAKMAVSPKAQGQSAGFKLGQAAIEKAHSLNANHVYLESNTILAPAIRLYTKLGFNKVVGPPTPYDRCNIQMELYL